jgi:polysaccharide pyruvyl transferase WcaK-like protein
MELNGAERLGPRIGVWGTSDLANYGDLLFPRIFEREILRRLPLATVRPYSPLGHLHPVAMDGGLPAAPLGPWNPARRAELAGVLDLVAVGGGDLIHVRDETYGRCYRWPPEETARRSPSRFFIDGLGPDLEASCPVAWHAVGAPFGFSPEEASRVREALATKAYVAVRDDLARERLLATGTDREVHVVPDSALLLPDLFPTEVLARRLHFLKTMGWYPAERPPLVLQGSSAIVRHAPAIAEAVRAVHGELGHPPIVLIEIGPCHGDGAFLDALAASLPEPVHRMPAAVTLEDVTAALANARAFAGLSLHGSITALSYGVPFVVTNLAGATKLDGFARLTGQEDALIHEAAELPDALRRAFAPDRPSSLRSVPDRLLPRIAAHFDHLAGLAERSWIARTERGERPGLPAMARELAASEERRRALLRERDALSARLVEERLRFAEIVDALEATGGGDARIAERAAELRGWVEVLEARAARADHLREQAEAGRAAAEARLASCEHLLGTRMLRGAARLQRLLARLRR